MMHTAPLLTSIQLWRVLARVFAACYGWTWDKAALLDLLVYCDEVHPLPAWLFTWAEIKAMTRARLCKNDNGWIKPVVEPPPHSAPVDRCLEAYIMEGESTASQVQDWWFETSHQGMYEDERLQL